MSARAALLAGMLLLATLPAAGAQAPTITAGLVSVSAGYGPEAWKDEPPLGAVVPALPLPVPGLALGVYENPYLGAPHQGPDAWLGHNLTATLELRDGADRPVESPGHTLQARLETLQGSIPAKLTRLSASRFTAQFDLDGENGRDLPDAPAGEARLVVEVFRAGGDPTVAPARVATSTFALQVESALLDLGGFLFDEAGLPGYADVGAGNQTLVRNEVARPGDTLVVTAQLGAPLAPASLVAWHRGAGVVLAQGPTDAAGRLTATVDAAQLVAGNQSGLAVLAASLDGSRGRLASAQVMVPVSSHDVRIVRYAYEARNVGAQPVQPLDTLLVGVEDLSASGADQPARGTLVLLDPAGESFFSVPFDPTSFLPGAQERIARVPGTAFDGADLTVYRLVALLLTPDGRLYSMARAARGYGIAGGEARALPFEEGALPLVVRNFNNNLDDVQDEGMALTVALRITGLPGGQNFSTEVTVPESGEARIDVPFRGDVGSYLVAINSSSGELRLDLQGRVDVQPAPRGFLGLPGFEAGVLALAVALGAALAQRRSRPR